MLCLSPYQRVFTHSLHDVLARTRDSSKTPRPYSLCPKVSNTNGKLLSPNHLRSLPAAPHSDLTARQYKGVIPGFDVRTSAWQHVFRGCFRSYSATASRGTIMFNGRNNSSVNKTPTNKTDSKYLCIIFEFHCNNNQL